MNKNKNLRKIVLTLETYREIFSPSKQQRAILRKAENKAQAILFQGMKVAMNKNVSTPIRGRRTSPIKTFNLTVPAKVTKGRFVTYTR
jgi:hypothetical protein